MVTIGKILTRTEEAAVPETARQTAKKVEKMVKYVSFSIMATRVGEFKVDTGDAELFGLQEGGCR
jgi:hypothetical protein